MASLTNLNLNKLYSITTTMVDNRTKQLKVRENFITAIPSWINHYPNIIEIDICCNKVSSIPELTYIKQLNLSGNELSTIELDMPELEYLSLTNNLLASFDLSRVTKLKNLDLAHNKLSSLDLTKLPKSLKVLRLGNNKITTLSGLENFPHLTLLALDGMNWVSIDKSKLNTSAKIFF